MSGWIKADWDFGAPFKTFIAPLRRLATLGVVFRGDDGPEEIERKANNAVGLFRQEIDINHLIVIGVTFRGGMTVAIDCVHPAFERVPLGRNNEVWLEPCGLCRCDLPVDGEFNFRVVQELDEGCHKSMQTGAPNISRLADEATEVAVRRPDVRAETSDWEYRGEDR